MNELLNVENLAAGYGGQLAIEDISLSVRQAETVALVGPNGCGKSTLFRAMTGVILTRCGLVQFAGEEITGLPVEQIMRRGIGYLKQTQNIFPGLKVRENLALAHLADGGRFDVRLADVLAIFPVLESLLGRRAGLLSGGERQTLALGMVLMRNLRLLLLDEPIGGLAERAARELLEGLRMMQRREGFTIILVEHRLRLIRPQVDRVIVMNRGRISEDTRYTDILIDRVRLEQHYRVQT